MASEKNSWLRDILELIDKYGIFKIFVAVFMMVFVAYATYLSLNPSIIFDRYTEYIEKQHSESFNYRMTNSPLVQNYTECLLNDTHALRAFVVEMHNGKYNSAGLSFNYGSMTYEALRDSAMSVREDYSDFSLERFMILNKVYKEGYWSGNIEDLAKIDKRMALRLESNNANYLMLIMLYGERDEIGFLGLTFAKSDEFDIAEAKKQLQKYSTKISPLLDGAEINKK